MLFVNPLYYQKWLPGPAFSIWSSTGASSSSSSTVNLQPRVTLSSPWDNALEHLWWGRARSEHVAICPRCFKKEAVGTIACYSCGITMTNSPISAEQARESAADPTTQLLSSLGLVLRKPEAENPRKLRGHKFAYTKTWEQRCKGWLHGSIKKKDPDTVRILYKSITDR